MGRPPAAFVGRDEALGVLRTAVRRASAGHPSVLIVTGETGVGKTRLVRELIEQERVTLLAGSCVPMAGDPLPFAPLTQALRRLDRTGTLNLQLERLPELARLVPGVVPAKATRTADLAAASQLGLFQSVLDLVDRLGAAAPVLHIVEDMHWADRSTLDLVRFLATNLTNERAVLLVTLRADAVVPATPLALWVAELARLENAERVELGRLDHDATARLVRQLAGDAADPEFIETTLARSAGNPLFAEQLVMQATQNPGHPALLPATLHELLHARVHALPEETQSVLRSAAVIGRPAFVTLLAATTGTLVEQTETLLRPAIDQHVVEIRRDDTIAFRHPAFGEVVYAELMPVERQRLHRAAAEALQPPEGLGTGQRSSAAADAVSGELARHWLGAGDKERALDAAVAAGWAAERMYAFSDAYTNFTRALALMDDVPDNPQDRVRMLKHAGQAASLVGDSTEAVRLVEAAVTLTSDPPARAALLTRLGLIHYRAGRGSLTERCLREALALVPADEESVLVARIHAGLALFGAAWSRLDIAEDSCRRGLAIARKVDARREEGLLVNASGLVEAAHGDIDSGARLLRQSLAIAAEVGNPDDLATAYINLSHVLGLGGRVDEIVEVARQGADVLTRMGLARQRVSFLKANLAETLGNAGRIAESGRVIAEALSQHPRGIMSVPVLIQAGRVAMVRGDLDEAWEWLEQARVIVESENAPGVLPPLPRGDRGGSRAVGRPSGRRIRPCHRRSRPRARNRRGRVCRHPGRARAEGTRDGCRGASGPRVAQTPRPPAAATRRRSRVARGQPAGGRGRARVGEGRENAVGLRQRSGGLERDRGSLAGTRPTLPQGIRALAGGGGPARLRSGRGRRSTPCATRIPQPWRSAPRGWCRSASASPAGTASTSSPNRSRRSRTPWTGTA